MVGISKKSSLLTENFLDKMKKPRLAILRNEMPEDHLLWIAACREMEDRVEWEVVDLTAADWLEKIRSGNFDGLLAVPPGFSTPFKTLYDERVRILNTVLKIPVYPTLEEITIYENKKFLSYWLEAHQIPHPSTRVFYDEKEAAAFVQHAALPLVGKINIGAGGSGVCILHTREEAENYVRETFSGGVTAQTGPKWRRKGFVKRVIKKLLRPSDLRNKLQTYHHVRSEVQKDFVLLQEFIPHDFEWRVVLIGDAYFAHKKIKVGEKASGSLVKGYDNPPLSLFDFVRSVCEPRHFVSQAVDLFESPDGRYLVNEMQCIFGQSDPQQMLIDGVPGRYRLLDGKWVFEAGDFNRLECFEARLQHFLEILKKK